MAFLPKTPFTLTGGCFCSAITYTISIPELSARPVLPELGTDEEYLGPQSENTERMPAIDLDQCNSCRRVHGSALILWIIIPQSWVRFSLQDKTTTTTAAAARLEPSTDDVITGKPSVVDQTFVTKFSSSEGVNRTFCGRCGTHLTFQYEKSVGMAKAAKEKGLEWEPHFDVNLATLDSESIEMKGMRPFTLSFPEDGIKWVRKWLKDGEKGFLE